jgi:hypothetical protein
MARASKAPLFVASRPRPVSRAARDQPVTGVRAPRPGTAQPEPRRGFLGQLPYVLWPCSVALWAFGIARTDVSNLGSYGLLSVLPAAFYLGIALLVVSSVLELRAPRPNPWRLALHVGALAVMLYGTAPLVYPEGRYSWLYKTVGVVQYIDTHGRLNPSIDIYQNWPGFFALMAWFDKVAGVSSPLVYAKWAQLTFELAALPLLYLAYGGLKLSVRQRWVGLFLFTASNWIGQDYLSPQALSYMLSLGIMAVALKWLYTDEPRRGPRPYPAEHTRRQEMMAVAAIVLLFSVTVFTHQLTPYMVVVQLGVLAVVRRLRPRWLPVLLAAIALGFLAPRFGYINSHYGILSNLGKLFRNARPPSLSSSGPVPFSQTTIEHCADALSVGIWGLAAVGAWHRRRTGQPILGTVLLTVSPALLLALVAYGTEGTLRVYLFSLPWAAALAASALSPAGAVDSGHTTRHAQPGRFARASRRRQKTRDWRDPVMPRVGLRATATAGALVLALALFLPAFFGDDEFNVMSPAEVAVTASFLQNAQAGPIYCPIDNAPLADTGNYSLFPITNMWGQYGILSRLPAGANLAAKLAADALNLTKGEGPAYVVITPSMIAYDKAYQVGPANAIADLTNQLRHSGYWVQITDYHGTEIYEMPATLRLIHGQATKASKKKS